MNNFLKVVFPLIILGCLSCSNKQKHEKFFLSLSREGRRRGSDINKENIDSKESRNFVFVGKKSNKYYTFCFKKHDSLYFPIGVSKTGDLENIDDIFSSLLKKNKDMVIDEVSFTLYDSICIEYHDWGDFLSKKDTVLKL